MAIPTIKYDQPKVFINGHEVVYNPKAEAITFTTDAKPEWEWKPTKPIEFSCKLNLSDEAKESFRLMQEELEKQRDTLIKAINYWVEDCVRTRVVPPIKGKITRGKIKWRGLALCYGPDGEFLGLLQHGKTLYHIDGNTYER